MSDKKLEQIYSYEILNYWKMLCDSDIPKIHGMEKLSHDVGKVMCNEYFAIKGLIDNEVKIIFIWDTELYFDSIGAVKKAVVSQTICGPRYLLFFMDMGIELFKSLGYSKITGIPGRNIDAMAKLLKFNKVTHSFIEKEI